MYIILQQTILVYYCSSILYYTIIPYNICLLLLAAKEVGINMDDAQLGTYYYYIVIVMYDVLQLQVSGLVGPQQYSSQRVRIQAWLGRPYSSMWGNISACGATLQPAGSASLPGRSALQPAGSAFLPGRSAFLPAGSAFLPAGSAFPPAGSEFQPAG